MYTLLIKREIQPKTLYITLNNPYTLYMTTHNNKQVLHIKDNSIG